MKASWQDRRNYNERNLRKQHIISILSPKLSLLPTSVRFVEKNSCGSKEGFNFEDETEPGFLAVIIKTSILKLHL